jgi:hypothetical protein
VLCKQAQVWLQEYGQNRDYIVPRDMLFSAEMAAANQVGYAGTLVWEVQALLWLDDGNTDFNYTGMFFCPFISLSGLPVNSVNSSILKVCLSVCCYIKSKQLSILSKSCLFFRIKLCCLARNAYLPGSLEVDKLTWRTAVHTTEAGSDAVQQQNWYMVSKVGNFFLRKSFMPVLFLKCIGDLRERVLLP